MMTTTLKYTLLFLCSLFLNIGNAQKINEDSTFVKDSLCYSSITNKPITGKVIAYYEGSTQPISVKCYNKGKLNGKTQFYYTTGHLLLKGKYKNNLRHGVWIVWNENSLWISKEHYKANNLNGSVIHRNAKGLKIEEGTYRNGQRIGWWTEWDENGNILLQTRKHEEH